MNATTHQRDTSTNLYASVDHLPPQQLGAIWCWQIIASTHHVDVLPGTPAAEAVAAGEPILVPVLRLTTPPLFAKMTYVYHIPCESDSSDQL